MFLKRISVSRTHDKSKSAVRVIILYWHGFIYSLLSDFFERIGRRMAILAMDTSALKPIEVFFWEEG